VRTLERKLALQCGPWARLAGAGEPIPASSPLGLAGEGHGGDLGGTRVRFGHWVGGQRRPVGGAPVAREGRSRWRPLPAVCGRGRS
jgi:hypothetical protein